MYHVLYDFTCQLSTAPGTFSSNQSSHHIHNQPNNRSVCVVLFSKVCGGDLPYVNPESLEEKHHFNFREALHTFSSTKKMGGQEFCDRYQTQLEKELEEMWVSFSKHNEVKDYSNI